MPLYFRALAHVPPLEMVAYRVVWSVLLLVAILHFRKRLSGLGDVLTSPHLLWPLAISSVLMGGNWLLYIWAVNSNQVVAASLGYFLNPMLNVLLGFLVLKERLSRIQWLAVGFAAAGVAVLAAGALSTLWISLTLGGSFAVYGLIRKLAPTGPMVGLSAETILLLPAALVGLGWWSANGSLAMVDANPATTALIIASGAITAIPLLLFAFAAQRLTLATLGLVQYIGPTLQFGIGVFLFGETLTTAHLVAFPLIWVALAIYSFGTLRTYARTRAG